MFQNPKKDPGYWIRRIQYPGSYWFLGPTVLLGREPLKIMNPAVRVAVLSYHLNLTLKSLLLDN